MLLPNELKRSESEVESNNLEIQLSGIKVQFDELNKHIVSAISEKNFSRVIALDSARQEILKDLCLRAPSIFDDDFFVFIEKCAKENALLISKVEDNMENLTSFTGKSMRMQSAYTR